MLRDKPVRIEPQSATSVDDGVSAPATLVAVRIPTGYDTRINVRITPNAGIKLIPMSGCQPRQGAARRDAEPLPLPLDLPEKLAGADRRVIEWLARDSTNSRLFMSQPVEALKRAGVELTRAEEKALMRLSSAALDAALVAPGVRVTSLNASAHPRGRVGSIPATPTEDRDQAEQGRDRERGSSGKE